MGKAHSAQSAFARRDNQIIFMFWRTGWQRRRDMCNMAAPSHCIRPPVIAHQVSGEKLELAVIDMQPSAYFRFADQIANSGANGPPLGDQLSDQEPGNIS
jgi:hypothetical protein